MGAGHDGAAKELRRRLEASGHRVEVVDFLDAVAFHIGPLLRWFYQVQLRMAPWSYELSYKLAPVLRAPAVMLDTWLTRRKLKRVDQGVPPRRGRLGVPARVARARPHAAQEAAARAGAHVPHRLRGALALGAPGHRPSPRGQRDLGRGRHLAWWQATPALAGPLVSDRFRDADLRPRRRAHQPGARARGPRRAGGRGLVGRRRRRRHRRGDRPQRRVPPDHRVRARRQPARRARAAAATAPSSAGPTRCPRSWPQPTRWSRTPVGSPAWRRSRSACPVITFKPIAGHGKDNAEMMARAGRQLLRARRRRAAHDAAPR